MHIAWGSLGVVFVVSFGSAVAVVVLISLALVGLSARVPAGSAVGAAGLDSGPGGTPRPGMSAATGTALGAVCLVAAALIVVFGLYVVVA